MARPTTSQDPTLAQAPLRREYLSFGDEYSDSTLAPRIEDDGLPVVGAVVETGSRLQMGRRSEPSHPILHCRVPAEFCEAAEHSVRCLPPVSPPAHLDTVQAGPGRCHRHEALRLNDPPLASEYDLHRLAAASKINIGQPDPVAVRMVPDVDDPPDDDALCPHSPRTLPFGLRTADSGSLALTNT